MAAEPIRRRFTTAEYHAMAESGILAPEDRVELIEGEIWRMSPIGPPHASRVTRLSYAFTENLKKEEALVISQSPIHLDDFSEPQPDLALLRFREDFYASALPAPEDVLLVVEVSDTTVHYDRRVKMDLYARHGIPEAWLCNLRSLSPGLWPDPHLPSWRQPLPARLPRPGDRGRSYPRLIRFE
jgi:hypothetical protein